MLQARMVADPQLGCDLPHAERNLLRRRGGSSDRWVPWFGNARQEDEWRALSRLDTSWKAHRQMNMLLWCSCLERAQALASLSVRTTFSSCVQQQPHDQSGKSSLFSLWRHTPAYRRAN
eukprot:scaffold731_cov261-Pinguiococcus_pyrenoidosus.AAC.39